VNTKRLIPLISGLMLAYGCILAQNVTITPLGARSGEFCSPDRALLFEDPTGVRILYDPGMTVAGGTDPRLGNVDVVLVTHAHGDHLGSAKLNQDPSASSARCDSQAAMTPTANSNAAEIAAAKHSAVIVSSELAAFLNGKIQGILGVPVSGCPATGPTNELLLPLSQPCTGNIGYGAKRTIRNAGAAKGVQIALVAALHGNELPAQFLDDPLKSQLAANRLGHAPGLASGYVLMFTNGLRAYLSGDTGQMSDMQTVVKGFYGANLAVLNIGDIFTTGPEEAAFVINRLIRPEAVIPSHANEVATTNGVVNLNTRTARFIQLVREVAVYPPLSGVAMQFNGEGHCIAGCAGQKHE
jgi:L-ascorbate metabolism protein UlaG (beta-lactamase superfamily)